MYEDGGWFHLHQKNEVWLAALNTAMYSLFLDRGFNSMGN